MTGCTATRKAASSMATTAITVTCRCISPVASTYCAAGCGAPTVTPATGQWRNWKAVVAQIRQRWPQTKILVRGDSGFCREKIMVWCEGNGVDYVLGLARNARLQRRIDQALRKSRRRSAASGQAARRFREFRYRTRDSWSRSRRVVAKAEWLPWRWRRQSALRGNQPRAADHCQAGPLRRAVLRPWRHGEPDPRSSNCGCSPTALRRRRCAPIRCGCTSRRLPASC